MGASADIRFETRGRLGLITLDRGGALNALTHAMLRGIADALDLWEADYRVAHVAIRSADARAFSAGGDIRDLYEAGLRAKRGEAEKPVGFFRDEYRLNHRIRTYLKPYVALIDGIAMGGGVGVSVNGRFRVAGEGMLFAMPEVGIGFFPDVGATHFLPRLPGETGTYLALTGSRIGRDDCLWCGISTHAVPRDRHEALVAALSGSADAESALADFAARSGGVAPLAAAQETLASLFAGNDAEAILERLDAYAAGSRLAEAAAKAMRRASPTSVKIALEQMRRGGALLFPEAMRAEYRIVNRILDGHDFFEGVRAQIVDKDRRPAWHPDRLDAADGAAVAASFAPPEREPDLPAHGRRA